MDKRINQKIFFVIFCLTYFIGSQIAPHFLNGQFIYPFYHWKLFEGPPIVREDYFITVEAFNDLNIEESCFLQNCHFLPPVAKRNRIYQKIQRFGRAVDQSPAQADELRDSLEKRLFRDGDSVSYQLVKIRYKPVDFVTKQIFYSKNSLGSFTKKMSLE